MKWIETLFRQSTDLTVGEMTIRAIVVFLVALVILRVAGKRTFGKQSPSDYVIMIMIGAILGRAVVGASPFLPIIASSLAIVIVHRLLAWASFGNKRIGTVVKGKPISLFKDGEENISNMKRTLISHDDVMEGVRLRIDGDTLDEIHEIFVERNGEISVVKKDRDKTGA